MSATRSTNRILSALSAKTYRSLSAKLQPFELIYKENLIKAGDEIKYVIFPEVGIISLLSTVEERSTLEVGIVGDEGMVGISLFLGETRSNTRALVQGPGTSLTMKASHFLKECARSDELPQILRKFTHSLLIQISQSAVCNRFHPVDERLGRWLLMTSDRMHSNVFPITQDFLSNMLGVRREAVSKSATKLQKKGMISYHRGEMTIHNRKELEAAACACYLIVSRRNGLG